MVEKVNKDLTIGMIMHCERKNHILIGNKNIFVGAIKFNFSKEIHEKL